jgi:transcriptional regulator with XRE-family HTH domain
MAAHSQAEQRLRRLLRALREEAGLTQTELGARIKQPQQVISKIERGERRLYATQLFEFCSKAFGIGPAEFGRRYERQK